MALLALASCSSTGGAPGQPMPGPSIGQSLNRMLPASVAHVRLTDASGRVVTLAALHGKIVVVSDMLTLCQGTCPLDTANVVGTARRLTDAGFGNKVAFLSVTVDPQRDVGSRLASYRRQYAPAPSDWYVLGGSARALNHFWDTLGVFRKQEPDAQPGPRDWLTGRRLTYDVTHSDEVFFFDGTGRERFLLQGLPHVSPGSPVPPELKRFVAAGDEGPTSSPHGWTTDQAVQVLSWLLDKKV
jgi:protein SCO1/2